MFFYLQIIIFNLKLNLTLGSLFHLLFSYKKTCSWLRFSFSMFFLDCAGLGKRQIQPFADVLQNRWSSKFRKACNFIKKRLKHKLFPGEYCKIFKNVFNKIPLVAASEKSFREFSSHNHTCLKQRERKKLKQRFWILLKDFVPVCLQAPFNDRGVATGRGGGGRGSYPPFNFRTKQGPTGSVSNIKYVAFYGCSELYGPEISLYITSSGQFTAVFHFF